MGLFRFNGDQRKQLTLDKDGQVQESHQPQPDPQGSPESHQEAQRQGCSRQQGTRPQVLEEHEVRQEAPKEGRQGLISAWLLLFNAMWFHSCATEKKKRKKPVLPPISAKKKKKKKKKKKS